MKRPDKRRADLVTVAAARMREAEFNRLDEKVGLIRFTLERWGLSFGRKQVK